MSNNHNDHDDDNDDFHEASSSYNDPDNANDGASVSSQDSDRDFHDAAELTDLIAEASSLKASGNAHFAAGRSHAALADYREGIAVLPEYQPPLKSNKSAKGKGKARLDLGEDMFKDDDEDELSSKKVNDPVKSKERIRELQDEEDEKEFVQDGTNTKSEEQIEMEQLRSALWCNIAACQLKLSLYKEAVEAATNALQDNPRYVKALQRRAAANEKLSTWTSLTSALEDYETLEKLSDTPKALQVTIRQAKRSIPGLIEERKQSETAEMLEKLKGLGNSFLGKFGMSTDNFQFVKNEETGGYSMNFTQTPPSNAGKK